MQDSQWLTDLAAQENIWTIQYQDTLPSMLVAEWENLERLAKDGQVYGVLLQCRDLLEGVMKVPVVMALAILDSSAERKDDPAYVEVIRRALEKSLSMGDWQTLARLIVKKQKKLYLPENLVHILRCTLALYDNSFPTGKSIVEWRNDTIGHGSLRFEADEGYRAEVGWLLPTLHSYFDGDEEWSVNDSYRSLVLQSGDMQFTGDNFAIADENAKVVLVADGKTYPVQHFATNRDLKCLLFDSYYFYKSKTKFSSYTDGQELLQENHYFSDLYETYVQKNTGDEKIAARNITADDDQLLAQLDMPNDYVKPVQLMDKLRKTMAEMEKGVILVQMERGTGKSALAGRLNGLYYKKDDLLLKKSFVRCYHVSSANLRGSSDFVNIVNDDFKASYNAGDRLKSGDKELKQLTWNTETPAADFAEFLNFYNDRYLPENYTVFVLDGIDELTERTEQILDFVPASADLDDGVFVLLLSRFEDEKTVLGSACAHIVRAKELADTVIAVERKSDINCAVLKEYAKKYAPGADLQKLAERADYRMLYLKADLLVRERAELDTTDETKFIESYLNYVLSFYGTARQEQLKQTLAAIAMFHSVSLNQFVDYLGWPEITYGKIGMMNDLMPLLTVVHRDGEDFYELADEAYADYVLKSYDEAVDEILRLFGSLIQQKIDEVYPSLHSLKWDDNAMWELQGKEELEKTVLFLGEGLVSLWRQKSRNIKMEAWIWSTPALLQVYEMLRLGTEYHDFVLSFNVLNLMDSLRDTLLENLIEVLHQNQPGNAAESWQKRICSWYNDLENLRIEDTDNWKYSFEFPITERPGFQALEQQLIQELPLLANPQDWYWVIYLCDMPQEFAARLNEIGQMTRFDEYCAVRGTPIALEWEDIESFSDAMGMTESDETGGPTSNEPSELKYTFAGYVADTAECLKSNTIGCKPLRSVHCILRMHEFRYRTENGTLLNKGDFAKLSLQWVKKAAGQVRPNKEGVELYCGILIPILQAIYGAEEGKWLPELLRLQQDFTAQAAKGHEEALILCGSLQYELAEYYLATDQRAKLKTGLKKLLEEYESIMLCYGVLRKRDMSTEPVCAEIKNLRFCTENTLFYLHLLYEDGEKEQGLNLIEAIDHGKEELKRILPAGEANVLLTRYLEEDLHPQNYRFRWICREYGLSSGVFCKLDKEQKKEKELLWNEVSGHLKKLSGNSDMRELIKLTDDWLYPAEYGMDFEELDNRCDMIIAEVNNLVQLQGEQLRPFLKILMDEVAERREHSPENGELGMKMLLEKDPPKIHRWL